MKVGQVAMDGWTTVWSGSCRVEIAKVQDGSALGPGRWGNRQRERCRCYKGSSETGSPGLQVGWAGLETRREEGRVDGRGDGQEEEAL